MANDNHLLSVTCYNVTMTYTECYNEFFELGQQKFNFSFFELNLPNDVPVYTHKKILEEFDFTILTTRYSSKERTMYNPIMMYAIVTYAKMRWVTSVDKIAELYEKDFAFIWLTKKPET